VVVSRALVVDGLGAWSIFPGRFVIGLGSLIAGLAVSGRMAGSRPGDWRRGTVLGLVNMAGPTVFLTLALEEIPASLNGLLVAIVPIATVLAAHVLVPGERFSTAGLPGLVVALVGVGVLLGRPGPVGGGSLMLGVALSLVGIGFAAVGGALSRRYALETPVTRLVVPQFVTATLVLLVLAVPAGGYPAYPDLTAAQWAGLAWLGLVSTTIPFFAFLRAIEIAPTAQVALIGYLVPLVGVAGGVIVLGEPLSLGLVAGGTLILIGVVAADRGRARVGTVRPR
jgi:drug/metabolite transporter (DMT)-like permease